MVIFYGYQVLLLASFAHFTSAFVEVKAPLHQSKPWLFAVFFDQQASYIKHDALMLWDNIEQWTYKHKKSSFGLGANVSAISSSRFDYFFVNATTMR